MRDSYYDLIDMALKSPVERVDSYPEDYRTLGVPVAAVHRWQSIFPPTREGREWSPGTALARLAVRQVEFDPDSSVEGYSSGRTFAIRPDTRVPLRVLLHELAHITLGHTFAETRTVGCRHLREVQAETVTFSVMALVGAANHHSVMMSRTYISEHSEASEYRLTDKGWSDVIGAIRVLLTAGQ